MVHQQQRWRAQGNKNLTKKFGLSITTETKKRSREQKKWEIRCFYSTKSSQPMNREKKEGYRRTSRRKEQQDEEHKLVPEDPCRSPNGRQQCTKIKDWMLDKLKLESIGLNSRWHARIKRKESKTFTQAIPEHFGEMGKETERRKNATNKFSLYLKNEKEQAPKKK